jgi:hypothetical protein
LRGIAEQKRCQIGEFFMAPKTFHRVLLQRARLEFPRRHPIVLDYLRRGLLNSRILHRLPPAGVNSSFTE